MKRKNLVEKNRSASRNEINR